MVEQARKESTITLLLFAVFALPAGYIIAKLTGVYVALAFVLFFILVFSVKNKLIVSIQKVRDKKISVLEKIFADTLNLSNATVEKGYPNEYTENKLVDSYFSLNIKADEKLYRTSWIQNKKGEFTLLSVVELGNFVYTNSEHTEELPPVKEQN
jgi:hypothetical protein